MAYLSSIQMQSQYDNGTFGNCEIDEVGNLKTAIYSPTTAFGEVMVAELTPVLQGHFNYNINTNIDAVTFVGSGGASQADSLAQVYSGVTPGSYGQLRSLKQIRYQNGQGTNMRFTALFSTPAAGALQIIGFGNETDGLFFGYSGTQFGILHRNNSVDTFIPQTNWNGDKFDGTGKSATVLDPSKGSVYAISMAWLGMGILRFMIEHPDEGDFHTVHDIRYSNANTIPSLTNPNFPFMIYASNTGADNVWVKSASYGAFIEGKEGIYTGLLNSAANTATVTTISNILTIRNKTSYNSKTNRHSVHPIFLSISCEGTKPIECRVLFNATVGGGSWTDVETDQSIVEYNNTATITGGKVMATMFLGKSDSKVIDLTPFVVELYPADRMTFFAHAINDSSADISVNLTWRERV